MFSHEPTREQQVIPLPGGMPAEERVAALLLNLSERLTTLGRSPSDLTLRLTGGEIANLLEINLATVTRILSKFQEDALIEIDGEHLRVVSIEGLHSRVGR